MPSRAIFATLALLSVSRVVAGADRFFAGPEPFELENGISSLVVEDLDGDGRPEAAATIEPSGSVLIARNDGDGSLLTPERYQVGVGPLWLAGAELDGMPGVDLFAINAGSGNVSVLRNTGLGSFLPSVESPTGPGPRTGDLGDLDGDGVLDAVTADWVADGRVSVLLGDGHGSFHLGGTVDLRDNAHAVELEDFDGDGSIDLFVANHPGKAVLGVLQLFKGRGNGGFHSAREVSVGLSVPRYMDTLRWSDSLPALVVLTDSDELFLVRLDPAGFRALRMGTGSDLIAAQDLDSDGVPDVLTASRDGFHWALRVHPGLQDKTFGEPHESALGAVRPVAVDFGDLDGNGETDIVVALHGAYLLIVRGVRASDPRSPVPLEIPTPLALMPWSEGSLGPSLIVLGRNSLYGARKGADGLPEAFPIRDFQSAAFQSMASGKFGSGDELLLAQTDLLGGKVLILSPDNTQGTPVERDPGAIPGVLTSGDFDADGIDDLAATDLGSNTASILLGPARQSWNRLDHVRSVEVGPGQSALIAEDLDADGALDLASATSGGAVLLFGDGRGGFPSRKLIETKEAARTLAVNRIGGSRELLLGHGERLRRFALPGLNPLGGEVAIGGEIQALDTADLDGNGEAEILAMTSEEVAVLCCGGHVERYTVGSSLKGLSVADLTGDGVLDLAAADSRAWVVTVLLGRSDGALVFRRGDADGGGRAELTDAIVILEHLFLGAEGLSCPDAGDTDDDGRLSLTDAVLLLQHLFLGGPAPALPGPVQCGRDPVADELGACIRGCSGG